MSEAWDTFDTMQDMDLSSTPGLKDILPPTMQSGCAVGRRLPAGLTQAEQQLLCRHFNVLTPENCMKPALLQPVEGQFDFDMADTLVDFAKAHDMAVVGHCLVWHQQCPDWFFQSGSDKACRDTVLARLRTHIHTILDHYRGRIQGWDVVNEAIDDHGSSLRPTPWLEQIGEDYIIKAFTYAHEADANLELYYNDYSIERPAKRARTLTMLRRLLDAGVRLDAVGIQGHWVLDQVPFEDIEATLIALDALGVKAMITELDLDVLDRPDCGAEVSLLKSYTIEGDPYRNGCPDEILARQAEQYARLFRLLADHADKVSRVSFWGLHDGQSWLNKWPAPRTNHALLFDRACGLKPAFHRVADVLGR